MNTPSPLERPTVDPESDKEVDLWEGGFSGKSMFGSWFVAGVVTIAGIVAISMIPAIRNNSYALYTAIGFLVLMWGYLFSVLMYRKLGMHYELTSQQLKHREGILFRKIDRIELIDIDDVNYRQGPIQAILGVGNITIRSSDSSHPELIMYGIADIANVSDMINNARRQERRKRGLHIEAI